MLLAFSIRLSIRIAAQWLALPFACQLRLTVGSVALAFAPFHAFPVLWVTLPVLVWLLDGATAPDGAGLYRRIRPAAGIGWWVGFGFFLAGMWWGRSRQGAETKA